MMNLNNTKRIYLGAVVAVVILTALLFLLPLHGVLITAYVFAIAGLAGFTLALHWASCRRQGLYVTTAAVPLLIFNYLVFDLILGTLVVAAYHFNIFRMSVGWFIFAELLLAGIFIWKLLALDAGKEKIEEVEVRVQEKSSGWRQMCLKISNISLEADAGMIKDIAAVRDAMRYADPVTEPELTEIETAIEKNITRLSSAIQAGDNETTRKISGEILLQIKQRSEITKSLK